MGWCVILPNLDKIMNLQIQKFIHFILLCGALVVGGCSDNVFVLDSPQDFSMSDLDWLDLSRTAFIKGGYDISEYQPIKSKYDGHSYSYFAKNKQNPLRGYVIWESLENPSTLSYTIYLEKKNSKIHCKISKTKA